MKSVDEMISVMQAANDGKEIERRPIDGIVCWLCEHTPMWDWEDNDYRVKPQEPKRIWMLEISSGDCAGVYLSKETVDGLLKSWPHHKVVEFIALTPEVRSKLGL